MPKLIVLLKLLLKQVRINNIRKFSIGSGSGVGAYSSILFSGGGNQSITIGQHAGVGRNCELHVWDENRIVIKDYATVNDNCKLLGDVAIERYSLLSANIFISSGNHYAFTDPVRLIKDQDNSVLNTTEGKLGHTKPVRIEEDCWIGYGVFVRQGVNIGRGAVIGANSVVLNDVEPYSVQGGVPAKEIRKRFQFNPPATILGSVNEHLPYFYRGFIHKAEALENSRQQHSIFLQEDAIAILAGVDAEPFFQIKGVKPSSGAVDMVVTYQNKFQWDLRIETNPFEHQLCAETAAPVSSRVCAGLFSSLKRQMEQHSVLCFEVRHPSDNYIGIQSIAFINEKN